MSALRPVSRARALVCNAVGAVTLAVIGLLFWMAIDRDPPFVRISGEIVPERPAPGQWVSVKWTVKGDRWCPGTLRRYVVDSHDVVWTIDPEPIAFGLQIPVSSSFSRRFQLPPQAWPGRATYRVQTSYVCNPLHRWWPVVTVGPDVPFEIADPRLDESVSHMRLMRR